MTPTASNRKVSWFSREDDLGTLDVSPDFQRRPVWQADQASYLIDTILNDLPFPEIYVRSQTTPEGKTTYQVVDGQQRIRAILDFSKNDLRLTGNDVSPKWNGKKFEDLGDKEKTQFWNYVVVTRELENVSDGDLRDLFRRLNINSVVLNDQELRNASYKGEFINLMEELADDEWWVDMRIVNVRQVRRMEDVEFVSELFVGMMAGPQDKKKTIDQFYAEYEREFPDKRRWEDRFIKTRELITRTLKPGDIRQWSGKGDFYTLFLVMTKYAKRAGQMRSKARARVRTALMRFRAEVDEAKRKDNVRRFRRAVHAYADAVTRASSDISRRKERLEILVELVEKNRRGQAR